jgi:hypothetical protein
MGFRTAVLKRRLWRISVLASTMFWLLPSNAFACGYHSNVSLARGLLNWVYPDALHVVGAISTAVAEKRLPAVAITGRGLGLFGYDSIVRSLERHAEQLRMSVGETIRPTFALVLIDSMLWTRFVSIGGDLRAHVHVSGPQAGDLVMISGEDVIREIANSRLSVGEAYRNKLIRLYGSEEQIAAFLALHSRIGDAGSDQ